MARLTSSGVRACAVLAVAALALTACDAANTASKTTGDASANTTAVADVTTPVITVNVRNGAKAVPVSTMVDVAAEHATLTGVKVSGGGADVKGALTTAGTSWTASGGLAAGTTYTVRISGTSDSGDPVRKVQRFTTQKLSLDQLTYPSVAPVQGETVGIGMPVIVTFDVPVTNHRSIQKHLKVTSTPAQTGAWHWISNNEVRWRPKKYWKAGTKVSVDADIKGIPAGNGIYGQVDKHVDFKIGAAHIYKVNTKTDQMRVFSNGKLLRTIPITTGQQPAYTTRSGVKVIIEKFVSKEMNSETVNITGADAYDIKGVKYAMRLTYSGEFIHAAPWSVYAQGHENVSHGCTGMSTDNAEWLFNMSRRGDVVEYTGTKRPMEPTNGYGDWNIPFKQYKKG